MYYQADPACPIFIELKSIAAKTFGVAGELGKLLAPHASRLKLAFVYGSVAKGTAAAASDIDLLWVGDLSPSELVLDMANAEQRLARISSSPTRKTSRGLLRGKPFPLLVSKGTRALLL